MAKRSFSIIAMVAILGAVSLGFAQIGGPSGPDQTGSLGAGDSIRASGLGSTTTMPTDGAPKSAHPTQPLTDTTEESARTEMPVKDRALSQQDKARMVFRHEVEVRMNSISDRALKLENRGGLVAQGLKRDFQNTVTQVHDEQRGIALAVQKSYGSNRDEFDKMKSGVKKRVAKLDDDLREAEKKFSK